ncbi:MAG: paraslipin [Eubacterium sp.]|nr:paraslipin [Eubacterium sp.]
MGPGGVIIIILLVVAFFVLCGSVRVVKQANAYVIENLGTYKCTWGVGLHLLIPVFEKVARRVSLKEQVADFPPQPVITKDNVTMRIDTVLFFQITDPKLYCYGVENPLSAIENLTATTLRNIIGDLELDQTLTSRETINAKMRATLDEATDPWGIKVNRVELKNIMPPAAIQESMEKQMKAERERREQIIRAEGEKKAAVLVSEGEKAAKILRAEADKEAAILAAEAAKQSAILAAEAEREAAIKRAEGQAEAIRAVQQANADGIRMLNESNPTDQVLTIKKLDAFQRAADGKSTKLIIPSELAGVAGLATAVTEAVKTSKE